MANEHLYTFPDTTNWGSAKKKSELQSLLAKLLPKLQQDATIIEAGSGRGEFAEIVKQRGFKYIGIEPSEALRSNLIAQGYRVLATPLPRIELEDNSADLVYSYDVVEHLGTYSTVLQFFSEANRVLAPGGHIIIIAPNAETLGMLFYMYDYQHSYFTSIARIESLLEDAGFEIAFSTSFLTPLGASSHKLIALIDRALAHTLLVFGRSPLVSALLGILLGHTLTFRIHKNLTDHVAVVGRKT